MSLLTTGASKIAPAAAAAVAVTTAASVYGNGAWVQLLAATGGPAVLLGLHATSPGTANRDFEIDVGVGAAGLEVTIATFAFHHGNTTGPNIYLLPIPIAGIPSGARIAARARASAVSSSTAVAIYYSENFDSDQQTLVPHACLPAAAAGVTVTPNAVAWNNSAWVQLTTGLADPVGLAGLAFTNATSPVDVEFELGTGAAGAEVPVTLLRWTTWWSGASNGTGLQAMALPAVVPVPASTRLAIRMRKTGTAVTVWNPKLLYYANLVAGRGQTVQAAIRVY